MISRRGFNRLENEHDVLPQSRVKLLAANCLTCTRRILLSNPSITVPGLTGERLIWIGNLRMQDPAAAIMHHNETVSPRSVNI